jgi:hypothetical protein
MYEIVFITYKEEISSSRYIDDIVMKFPYHRTHWVRGVKGIHNAHREAASRVFSKMFYVVDADARLLPSFKFDTRLDPSEEDIVHVWRSINPVNGLEYGFGGVKLLPTDLTLSMSLDSVDMTTSISPRFKIMPEISNITAFNTDPLSTWRSAFRECVKLSSRIILGQDNFESETRLNAWIHFGGNEPFGEYSKGGASAGNWYGTTYKDDPVMLAKINDFDWLEQQFNEHIKLFPPETFK